MFDAGLLGWIGILRFSFKALTAVAHKSVKLPVLRVYLRPVYWALYEAGEYVLTGKGSSSLTTVLISRVLRGLGVSLRKMGGKRECDWGSSLVLARSAFLCGYAWFNGKDWWLPIEVVQLLHWALYGCVLSAVLYWLMCEEGLVLGRGRDEKKPDGRRGPWAEWPEAELKMQQVYDKNGQMSHLRRGQVTLRRKPLFWLWWWSFWQAVKLKLC